MSESINQWRDTNTPSEGPVCLSGPGADGDEGVGRGVLGRGIRVCESLWSEELQSRYMRCSAEGRKACAGDSAAGGGGVCVCV